MRRRHGARLPVARLAPWATALLLVALPVVLPNRAAVDGAVAARHEAIATALGAAPFIAGDWVGEDAPVPREAQELLRPTAILSRSYERLERAGVAPVAAARLHLLVVHCADARDMLGHYPPVCYPSSGWTRLDVERSDEVIRVAAGASFGAALLPVRVYRFRREREHGGPETITVLSAFVLPGSTVTRDIADLSRRTERIALAAEGVAQLQIIAPDEERASALDAAGDLLGEMHGLLETLGIGERGEAAR